MCWVSVRIVIGFKQALQVVVVGTAEREGREEGEERVLGE